MKKILFYTMLSSICMIFFSCAKDDDSDYYEIIGKRFVRSVVDENTGEDWYNVYYFKDDKTLIFQEISEDLIYYEKPVYYTYTRDWNEIIVSGTNSQTIEVQSENKIKVIDGSWNATFSVLTDANTIKILDDILSKNKSSKKKVFRQFQTKF